MIDLNFHERIRSLRQQYNMSQRDLANLLHISDRGVQEWENPAGRAGKPVYPRLNQLVRLAEIFNMSINELIGVPVPVKDDIKPMNVFLRGDKWYYWEIRWGVGRILRGPFTAEREARKDLKERRGGRGMFERPHPENRNPYPGVVWHVHSRRWIVQRYYHGERHYLGVFYDQEDAINAVKKWESTHADAKHTNYVRPGRWQDNVGPGPGQRGPQDRDVGKRLQGDERPVHPWRKAVFGRGTGVLPRSNDQQETSGVSDVQETLPRDELPGEGE